jgi:Nif-specific regulatory protein
LCHHGERVAAGDRATPVTAPMAMSATPSEDTARLRLLYDLGSAFAARIDLDELVSLVVAKCCEAFDAESAAVLLLDPERNELYFPYVAGAPPEVAARLAKLRFPADRGIVGTVLQSGRALRVDDARSDPRFYPNVDHETGLTTRALLTAPLTSHQGRIGAVQIVNRRHGGSFSDEDLSLLEALAGSIAIAIENASLYARLKESEERLRAQVGVLRRDLARHDRFGEIIGATPAMQQVLQLMDSAAASPIAVLLEGETGTGKELVARGIHEASARAEGPFVPVNCAALPENLLESQLFGHRRGAFTGATHDQCGLFEAATGGTIFLDEIGDMPAAMQAKLLRVLQEGEVVPVGDTRPRTVDVRVISATNRDLGAAVAARSFRQDLYYRLAAFPIRLPPLREHREDIPLLVNHVLARATEHHHKRIAGLHPVALECLVRFDWPGNVRELQNELERAVALAQDGQQITPAHLSPKLCAVGDAISDASTTSGEPAAGTAGEATLGEADQAPRSLRKARATFEARHIAETLREHGGNVSRAAAALGLSRVMLQKKMKEYGLR